MPWSSDYHLQIKSSGGLRPCGDFLDLNSKTALDSFPLPNLCHFTHKLKGSNTFSKVDLVKASHQIALDEASKMKTTVKTPWGVYFFKRLAMGLFNSRPSECLVEHDLDGLEILSIIS